MVPDKGYDAVLFGAMAVVVAVLLQGKYSALWTLVAGTSFSSSLTCSLQAHHVGENLYASRLSNGVLTGGVLQAIALPFKTGPVGNGIAIWLGIQPADLFLYIFLPPMLVDAAVRIDFFIFRKVGQTSKYHKFALGHFIKLNSLTSPKGV